jgi:hypothetical protein
MKKNNYRIIGVDFDGTLAHTRGIYPNIGEPIAEVMDYILEEQKKGAYLILITMREGDELDMAVRWCNEHGIVFDAVNDNLPHMKEFFKNNPRKIFCNEYLDDTNIGGIEGVLDQIRRKKKDDNN